VAARAVERPPVRTRLFVAAFLSAFLVCGFAGIEAWPLTGWRLFSHLRTPTLTTWQAETLDAAGHTRQLRFDELPRAYRNFTLIMKSFDSRPPGEQESACADWAAAARAAGRKVAAVRVFRLTWDLSKREGGRSRLLARRLVYEC
jgi:hypothetical protein